MILYLVTFLIIISNGAHSIRDREASTIELADSRFFFGIFCCPSVRGKCQVACGSRTCSSQCGGKCGLFNLNNCGPYTCSSISNACNSPTTPTTPAATTAVASTTGVTTAT